MITGYSAELNLYKATPIRFIFSPFPPAHTRITASIFHYPCIKHINLYCNNEKIIMNINEPPARISPACERRNKEFNWSGLKHVLYLQNKDHKNHEKDYKKKNHHKVVRKNEITLLHAFRKCFITDSV